MTRHLVCIALCLVIPPAASSYASPDEDGGEEEPRFNFNWEQATDDDQREEFERLMRRGRQAILDSSEAYNSRSGADHAMIAADLFARAAKLRPKDPKPHFYAAEAIRHWDSITYTFPKRIKQAIHHLSEFMRLAPYDSRVPSALFARSIAYTKLGGEDNIRLALDDYDQRLQMKDQLSLDPWERSDLGLILSNSAELHMYVGELDRALALYYDSLEYAVGQSASLYRYGLAVALDRDGQRTRAAAVMKEALRTDPHGPLGGLTRDGVFFIPEGDIQFYRALAFETLGDRRKALTFYRRFLAVLPDSRYAERARENVKTLETAKAAGPAETGDKPDPILRP